MLLDAPDTTDNAGTSIAIEILNIRMILVIELIYVVEIGIWPYYFTNRPANLSRVGY